MENVVIIGFGGHAKSVADSICKGKNFHIFGYTDVKDRHNEYDYLGTDDILPELFNRGVHKAVLGVGFMGENDLRDSLVNYASQIGFVFPAIIDPSAISANDVVIGAGTYIGKRAVINSGARIGAYCIVNTGSVVEHESVIGDFSHVSVGTILCGSVSVRHHSFIGAGTTVIQGVKIGYDCIIGAGSTVLSDVGDGEKVWGIVNKRSC